MSVKLKMEELSDRRKSLYLDVYIDQNNSYRKGLKMYLLVENSNSDKVVNKETWKIAQIIRNEYELDLLNKRLGKEDPRKKYNNSFLDYFEQIVQHRYETGVNYNTWYSVRKHLKNFSKGKLTFDQITETWLEGFKAYLLSKVSQNSSHAYFNKVKKAVHSAYREKILEDNPAYNVPSPKLVGAKREYLTEAELIRLKDVDCKFPILKTAFFFSVMTGLRWSDVQNLTWDKVREDNGNYTLVFTQKKTKEAEVLPINKNVLGLIGERRSDQERVFKGLKYSAWHNVAIREWMWAADIKKHITFHCARHTHATLLINKGVELYTVSKLLGHKELRTTQIYAKLVSDTKVKAVEQLPDIF